jgi:L-threonylcarbamoyladenylate synthase
MSEQNHAESPWDAETQAALTRALTLLQAGDVVAMPTETVYGLAGNALNPAAVERIFALKGRPKNDPLIVHVGNLEQAEALCSEFPEPLRKLALAFWPGPLTLLLPKNAAVSDLVTSGLPRVAVRMPNHPLALALLQGLDFPLAAPSANPFGYVSPTTAEHVRKQLGDKIPVILDGGPCQVGLESTIVGFDEGQVTVYRFGGIAREQLHVALGGPVKISDALTHQKASAEQQAQAAPGLLKSHYAPRKKLHFGDIDKWFDAYPRNKIGVISLRRIFPEVPRENQKILAIEGDLTKAARVLFAALRELDEDPKIEVILAQKFPDFGLGQAINDRLRRAAAN